MSPRLLVPFPRACVLVSSSSFAPPPFLFLVSSYPRPCHCVIISLTISPHVFVSSSFESLCPHHCLFILVSLCPCVLRLRPNCSCWTRCFVDSRVFNLLKWKLLKLTLQSSERLTHVDVPPHFTMQSLFYVYFCLFPRTVTVFQHVDSEVYITFNLCSLNTFRGKWGAEPWNRLHMTLRSQWGSEQI